MPLPQALQRDPCCPAQFTNWRSSSQMAQCAGGSADAAYWVPQVTQMKGATAYARVSWISVISEGAPSLSGGPQ